MTLNTCSLIDQLMRGVQRRDGAANELALKLKLALQHLLEQLGLVLQRSHQIARRSSRARGKRGGHPA